MKLRFSIFWCICWLTVVNPNFEALFCNRRVTLKMNKKLVCRRNDRISNTSSVSTSLSSDERRAYAWSISYFNPIITRSAWYRLSSGMQMCWKNNCQLISETNLNIVYLQVQWFSNENDSNSSKICCPSGNRMIQSQSTSFG